MVSALYEETVNRQVSSKNAVLKNGDALVHLRNISVCLLRKSCFEVFVKSLLLLSTKRKPSDSKK